MYKIWEEKKQNEAKVAEYMEKYSVSETAARVLYNRTGENDELASAFFDSEPERLFDPFSLDGMDKAVSRIKRAVRDGEVMAVYGDYDVDGITSSALMVRYLRSRGALVDFYIPSRTEEGYGINLTALQNIRNNGVSLVITVDNGITAAKEINAAGEFGLDVIVTDHHECKAEVPDCVAVINPKLSENYPFKDLAGVGVAFKLICALEGPGSERAILDAYGDIIALGTIADVVSLLSENRIITKYGLSVMNEGRACAGLRALIELCNLTEKRITPSVVGFVLAPRLNAAGRMGPTQYAVNLLLDEDREKLMKIAADLCEENRIRQETEAELMEQAERLLPPRECIKDDRIIILEGQGWHHGVIGIIASKLTDKYHVPSVLLSSDGETAKGSGRSIPGFSLFEALSASSSHLFKYGGHELAAGLSLKCSEIESFREDMKHYAAEKITDDMLVTRLAYECRLDPAKADLALYRELNRFEPFGTGNSAPLFLLSGLKILKSVPLSQRKYTRLSLTDGNRQITALCFDRCYDSLDAAEGDTVDIIASLSENDFRNRITVQLVVKDLRPSSEAEGFGPVDIASIEKSAVPDITELRAVYKYFRQRVRDSVFTVGYRSLSEHIFTEQYVRISPEKLDVALHVLMELGIFRFSRDDGGIALKMLMSSGKVNIASSQSYRYLLEKYNLTV